MSDIGLRQHLKDLLDGRSAHIDIAGVLENFPVERMNERIGGSPHSAWELLEHIRIAQWDILEFSRNSSHESPKWPDEYWPATEGTAEDWDRSAKQVLADLEALRELARDESLDLFGPIVHGDGQTLLREILLVADHNAYHGGQLMLVRKMLETA